MKRIYSQNASSGENINIVAFDQDEIDNEFIMENELRMWSLKHRITHMALNDLLLVLNKAGISSEIGKPLPKDSRTIMKTPANIEIQTLTHGKLWYNGVQKCLENILSNINRNATINLNFNFDGVPLYNSSRICFWPILGSIQGINKYILCVFCIDQFINSKNLYTFGMPQLTICDQLQIVHFFHTFYTKSIL